MNFSGMTQFCLYLNTDMNNMFNVHAIYFQRKEIAEKKSKFQCKRNEKSFP